MSSFIVSSQTIFDLAYFFNQLCWSKSCFINSDYVRNMFVVKNSYGTTRNIAEKLYCLNVKAVNGRYGKDSSPDFEAFANGVKPKIPSLVKFKQKDFVYIFKKIQCYLYQCLEEDCDKSPIYQRLTVLNEKLAKFIIYKLPDYEEVAWN